MAETTRVIHLGPKAEAEPTREIELLDVLEETSPILDPEATQPIETEATQLPGGGCMIVRKEGDRRRTERREIPEFRAEGQESRSGQERRSGEDRREPEPEPERLVSRGPLSDEEFWRQVQSIANSYVVGSRGRR